jgi:hypothetical protein
MLVYNISIKITPAIEKDWVQWQQQEHIPAIMATGCFVDYKFYKLLEQEEAEGITYIIQYFANTQQAYQQYINDTAPLLRQKALDRWGNQFIAFRSIMRTVN